MATPPPFDTTDQEWVERRACLVLDGLPASLRSQIVERLATHDPTATDATLQLAFDELAACSAMQTVNSDPAHPRVHWSVFPGSRAGLDNPDTRYRFVPLSDAIAYELRGTRGSSIDVSFQLFDSWQGDGVIGNQIGFLDGSALTVESDGGFVVTLDAEPSNGRPNHIQLTEPWSQLTIRDTLATWDETPMSLEIVRLGAATETDESTPVEDALINRTAQLIDAQATFWMFIADAFRSMEPNTIGTPSPTPGGLATQLSCAGHIALGDDEVAVIRAGRGDAAYVGFQLGTWQFVSVEPWLHPGSFNPSQLAFEPDQTGRFEIVVSHSDPGHPNWASPGGRPGALVFMRWQGLGGQLSVDDHPTLEVVTTEEAKAMGGASQPRRPRGRPLAPRFIGRA